MPAPAFFLAYCIPLLHLAALDLRGGWVWLTLGFVFGVVPLLDALCGHELRDAPQDSQRSRWADLPLQLWLPMQVAVLLWTLYALQQQPPTSGLEWSGLLVSFAMVAGAGGITVAHEWMHRPTRAARATAECLMSLTLYGHFVIEHVHGHHRRVATPQDPASARRGESLYAFVLRSIAQGTVSAWRLEGERCQRRKIVRFGPRDRRMRLALMQTALIGAVASVFGAPGALFFLGQAVFSVLLLEVINYIEHYGLARAARPQGGWERVRPQHSWNSTRRLTGAFLFQLTRHSDHHAEASRPFDRLRALPDAPQLPASYPSMMLLSLLPPLWFRVMDARLVD